MDLFNELGKKIENNKFVTNFMNELEKTLKEEESKKGIGLKGNNLMNDGDIYVVYVLKDSSDKANLLNVATSEQVEVDKETLSNVSVGKLELGDNFIYKDGKLNPYKEEFEISSRAWELLEPLYFNLKEEDGRHYEVTAIDNDKIHIRDTKINAKYTEDRNNYMDWKVGDKLVRKNGEYVKE